MLLRNTSKKRKHLSIRLILVTVQKKMQAKNRVIYGREFKAKQENFIMGRNVSDVHTVQDLENIAFHLTSEKDRTSFKITNDRDTNSKHHCLLEVTAIEYNRSPTAKTDKDLRTKYSLLNLSWTTWNCICNCVFYQEKRLYFLHLNPDWSNRWSSSRIMIGVVVVEEETIASRIHPFFSNMCDNFKAEIIT